MYRNAHFPWRFDETAKEMHNLLGGLTKRPRKCTFSLADFENRQGNYKFSWLPTKPAKKLCFLGC